MKRPTRLKSEDSGEKNFINILYSDFKEEKKNGR